MQLIQFFLAFFLFLLSSSLVITAFFCITRGHVEIMPDGTERRYGKILKGYYFFWFREQQRVKIWYRDDELANLTQRIKEYYADSISLRGDPLTTGAITEFKTSSKFLDVISIIRHRLEVKFEVRASDDNTVLVTVYTEEPQYYFPEWLRTVMAGCITCTPTVYGNLTFWSAMLLFKRDVLNTSFFQFFRNEHIGMVALWIVYWISLAWLNTVLWNIYNK